MSIAIERDGDVTRITLSRSDKANALDSALVDALAGAVDAASRDGTRLLVLTGAGRHFCGGFDFAGFEDLSEADLVLRFIRIELLLQAIAHAPIATLALAQGSAFGAGADLFLACRQRIAAPGTRFRMPGLRFGIVLGTRRLAARIGAEAAWSMLSTSRVFDASEAARCGFVQSIAGTEAWPGIVAAALADAQQLAPDAASSLSRLTIPDTRDADLADLVRSAQAPGLKDRIRAFRASPG